MRNALLAAGVLFLCSTAPAAPAERTTFSWRRQHARVSPKGDLEWQPEPFVFEKGDSVRYIDFESGSDDSDGESRNTAWKHHPWDKAAGGKAAACKGIHTYVFKRGATYRGELVARDSGKPGDPIRLTSDPAWGRGEAVIAGSEQLEGKWRKANRQIAPKIPDADKVWYHDVDWYPRCLWEVRDGEITRLPLARTPNWKVSNPDDVKSEWWCWENPKWWEIKYQTKGKGGKDVILGVDKKHLTKSADYYIGGIVRSEFVFVMGTPFPSRIETYDPQKKGIGFQGAVAGTSHKVITNNRYYLEDKPHYLDEPGEWYFEPKGGNSGRLFVRLPEDRDPNKAQIEVAKVRNLLDISNQSHLAITGLAFRFTNVYKDLTLRSLSQRDLDFSCIRMVGKCSDLTVANCKFEHVNRAIRFKVDKANDVGDQIMICDNEISWTDHGAINIGDGNGWKKVDPPLGRLYDVKILRNKLYQIALRPARWNFGHALCVRFAQTLEVAGNLLHRTYGAGIFLHGGKAGSTLADRPLSRVLVHHNKVTDSLLNTDDWGGIETWQGGPFYIYDNISGNPNGYQHFQATRKRRACLGFAYYLDGGFKNYLFNNIAWGKSNVPVSMYSNHTAFYEATATMHNTFFNNTAHKFRQGSGWSPTAGYHKYLGNIWSDISVMVYGHGKLKEDKPGAHDVEYPHETTAYARNVYHKIGEHLGVFEKSGKGYRDAESFKQALKKRQNLSTDFGDVSQAPLLRDGDGHDFRPAAGSAAIDHGVKAFVPWSLYGMVGEWNFYPAGNDPTRILDEHWYMTPYYLGRGGYRKRPLYSLKAVNVTAQDYVKGDLEDWIDGALKLNGRNQYAVLTNAELDKPFRFDEKTRFRQIKDSVTGERLKNPEIHKSNFLIEVYFKTAPGQTRGILMQKLGSAGYALTVSASGGVTFAARGGGAAGKVESNARVNDGKWHHALAEADREAGTLALYIDGKRDATAAGIGTGVSLANNADLYVGGSPKGNCLEGTIDFLRVALGTLEDAKTTIEELYEWEFNGPFLRDFAGSAIADGRRDAGALEYTGD